MRSRRADSSSQEKQKDVMLVDQDSFPDRMPGNMLTPKFKLVLDTSYEKPKGPVSIKGWVSCKNQCLDPLMRSCFVLDVMQS